jgi:hypothetical protein
MGFELGLTIPAFLAWFGVLGVCLLLTRPRHVQPVQPTQDLGGDEPPAIVSLLAHGWELTDTAARATLLDLAARRLIELRQPGNDPLQTTIHPRVPADTAGLTRYERRVHDRVTALAADGVVPLTALTFRDQGQAQTWAKRLRAEVVADARQRGLSRRRLPSVVRTTLTAGAALVALAVGIAMLHYSHRPHPVSHQVSYHAGSGNSSMAPWLAGPIVTFAVLAAIPYAPFGERDTEAGRAAAARWLGLREFLRGDEAFAALPPAAVAVWDRYLPYGCALGCTRAVDRAVDLGMGDRTRVWSSFGGGWHRVRVRYPRFWGRYGKKPFPLAFWAVVCLAAGLAVLRYRGRALDALTGLPAGAHHLIALVSVAAGLYLVGRGGYRLVRDIVDAATPVTITGEALWDEVWKTGNNSPSLHYLAVDDGRTDRSGRPSTTAWGLPSGLAGRFQVGDVVRIRTRRWTRLVLEITVVEPGRARQLTGFSSESPERMIEDAMASASPRGQSAGTRATVPAAGTLLTADEVSRAIGTQVAPRPSAPAAARPMPMSLQAYEVDGRQVVRVAVAAGIAARMVLRARHAGTPLPGVGDEAYQGDHWAGARVGDRAVGVQVDGSVGPLHPNSLPWLLQTAVSRLPAGQPGPGVPDR